MDLIILKILFIKGDVLYPPRPELILINKDYLYHFIESSLNL